MVDLTDNEQNSLQWIFGTTMGWSANSDADSDAVIIINGDDRLGVTVDETNLETLFPEKEDDAAQWISHRCLQGRPMFQPKHFLNHNLVL